MPRLLPVTLVGGFLGAGKTSVLHHFITEHQGGHLALLVDSPGPLNPDANALRGLCGAMRRNQDLVLEIPSGDDAAHLQIVKTRLREFSKAGRFERVLIEVGGLTNAARWHHLLKTCVEIYLEKIICVVDLLEFYKTMISPHPFGGSKHLAALQRAQVEGANLIILNKCDIAGDLERKKVTSFLRSLNSEAHIIETAYGEVPPKVLLESISESRPHKIPVLPSPTEDSNMFESAVYRAHRPFHPERFWNWFNADHAGVLRVKGLIWLATRNLLVGGLSRTTLQNSCGAAGIWWAALPREEWPTDPLMLTEMQSNWREPYGDRRQELLLVGEAQITTGVAHQLNSCLLSDGEYKRPHADWLSYADPFPAWDLES